MDYSTASAYENISEINNVSESVLYQAVNNVLSVTTINGNKIFCPLCVKTFQLKFMLLDHLKTIHYHFLRRTTEKSFTHEQCPFCYANFFGRHTIVRHVLQMHSTLISRLYLRSQRYSNSELKKCLFCNMLFQKNSAMEFACHIEHKHFLQFVELFGEQFMQIHDSISTVEDKEAIFPPKLSNQNFPSDSENNKENYFDFSTMKEQLFEVECIKNNLKSILTSHKTNEDESSQFKRTKVCRVLKFNLPDENKENSVLAQNLKAEKQLTLGEHGLLYRSGTREFLAESTNNTETSIQPIHFSTPKDKSKCGTKKSTDKKVKKKLKRKLEIKKKATFKSYFYTKDYIFQCGKCKKLFQENADLNFHIKKNHKLFMLNLLHPCYKCAICEAKFFKNYYLKKHIMFHTGFKE